jgi:glutamate-1-semialdehyde 2,1-aminomutase
VHAARRAADLDEVMTGFRVALGGAQSVYARSIPGFEPDLTVLGKVIGGGMPLAAFGGKRAVMEQLAPLGPVYQAGTLSGNPVATACGLATLREIGQPGFFEAWAPDTPPGRRPEGGSAKSRRAFAADSEGGMFGFFLLPELPRNYGQVMQSDGARFNTLFHGLLERGVYLAPALYEAGFVSAAHSEADIDATLSAARGVPLTLTSNDEMTSPLRGLNDLAALAASMTRSAMDSHGAWRRHRGRAAARSLSAAKSSVIRQ